MKPIKALFLLATLTASSFAMAEGGADRTFARIEQARQVSINAYRLAMQQKADAPVANSPAELPRHSHC